MAQEVTILIPSFNTLELTRLCLRSIRKHTDKKRIKVFVVDNGSHDGSVEYLKDLPWIRVYQRPPVAESGLVQQAKSLDMVFEDVRTPYVMSIHTDTIIKKDGWLDFMLDGFKDAPDVAGVGSWALAKKSLSEKIIERYEEFVRYNFITPFQNPVHDNDAVNSYLKSYCALFKTDLVRTKTRGFFDGMQTCKSLCKMLENAGYRMAFLDKNGLSGFMTHLGHATVIMNPEIFKVSHNYVSSLSRNRLSRALNKAEYKKILADGSLDS